MRYSWFKPLARRRRLSATGERPASEHKLFGVWNAEDAEGLTPGARRAPDRYRLEGAKTFCSGGGYVERPFVNGKLPDGSWQMCIVPMDEVNTSCDRTWWQPMGMRATASYKIDFSGVELGAEALIGQPGDYLRQPWLTAGVVRFAAVQLGGAEALFDLTRQYLQGEERTEHPYQQERLGQMAIALESRQPLAARGRRSPGRLRPAVWRRARRRPSPPGATGGLRQHDAYRHRANLYGGDAAVSALGGYAGAAAAPRHRAGAARSDPVPAAARLRCGHCRGRSPRPVPDFPGRQPMAPLTPSLTEASPLAAVASLPLRALGDLPLTPVLVVAPHPDDETLGCGGAIAQLRSQGYPVQVLVISDGTPISSAIAAVPRPPAATAAGLRNPGRPGSAAS